MSFSTTNPAGIALVGAGNIARRYVTGMERFSQLNLVGVYDAIPAAASALADEVGIDAYASLDELLGDSRVHVVVNITPPTIHAEINLMVLEAGKHVYSEKPIADTLESALPGVAFAKARELTFGVAPDTFLGSAGRTARRAIDGGLIGEPVAASLFITHSKAEAWHPDPTFLFQPGGGPLLDLGPYYITAIVNLLGPVAEVFGYTRIGAPKRAVTAPDRRVDSIEVNTPTHATASLRLESGVLVTAMFSFDVWDAHLPKIEIYGTNGTLTLPDPNEFDGPVKLRTHGSEDWVTLDPVVAPSGAPGEFVQYLRGYGVADLVDSLGGSALRPSSDLGVHVLEALEGIQKSSDRRAPVTISNSTRRPAAVGD